MNEPSFQLNLHFSDFTGNCFDYEGNVSNNKLCLLSPSMHLVKGCQDIVLISCDKKTKQT